MSGLFLHPPQAYLQFACCRSAYDAMYPLGFGGLTYSRHVPYEHVMQTCASCLTPFLSRAFSFVVSTMVLGVTPGFVWVHTPQMGLGKANLPASTATALTDVHVSK